MERKVTRYNCDLNSYKTHGSIQDAIISFYIEHDVVPREDDVFEIYKYECVETLTVDVKNHIKF